MPNDTSVKSLHPYQEIAVSRIKTVKGPLVAYDMGLGKTPISIVAIEQLMAEGKIERTVLVVMLRTLLDQWPGEFEGWAPESTFRVVSGEQSPKKRRDIYAEIEKDPPDYLLTNYETVANDFGWFIQQGWGALVCDEIHAAKSFRAKRSKALKALAKRIPIRVGLTGTPMSNGTPEELFSIMEVLNPKVLGNFHTFDRQYIVRNARGAPIRYKNLPDLHRRLAPYVIVKRQSDPDVKDFLPDIVDAPPHFVPWDRAGWSLYRTISGDLSKVLDEAQELMGNDYTFNVAAHYGQSDERVSALSIEEYRIQGEIMSRIQALRMLSSHPEVLRISAQKFLQRDGSSGEGSSYAAWLLEQGLLDGSLKSPKVAAVVPYIRDFLGVSPEHKVVVFSGFVDSLPLIEKELTGFGVQLYSGRMTSKEQTASKRAFQSDPSARVFLSSDAGGVGVDLPQANMLINFDLPWSSGQANQRNSRIIRASSKWPSVRIDRFLMQNSIESLRQWEMLQRKTAVSAAVITGGHTDPTGDVTNTVQGLRAIVQTALDL